MAEHLVPLLENLKKESPFGEEETVYQLSDVKALSNELIELPQNGLLAVKIQDEFIVSFCCLSWYSGEGDDALYVVVFHGYGFSSSLRECRHTYWGDGENSGYIFYPKADLMIAALENLKKWFHMD